MTPRKIREDTNLHARESGKPRVTSASLLTLLATQTWSGLTLQAPCPGEAAPGFKPSFPSPGNFILGTDKASSNSSCSGQ